MVPCKRETDAAIATIPTVSLQQARHVRPHPVGRPAAACPAGLRWPATLRPLGHRRPGPVHRSVRPHGAAHVRRSASRPPARRPRGAAHRSCKAIIATRQQSAGWQLAECHIPGPGISFATDAVAVAIEMSSIARRTPAYRRCSGGAGCSAVGKPDIIGQPLRRCGRRSIPGRAAMTMPTAVLAIVMASVGGGSSRMGKGQRGRNGQRKHSDWQQAVIHLSLSSTGCHAWPLPASLVAAMLSPVSVPARRETIAHHRA